MAKEAEGKRSGAKKVADWKKGKVKEISKDLEKYPTIAIINMQNLPSKQLQTIRAKLRGKAEIVMTRKRIINNAFGSSKNQKLAELIEKAEGMPAILFSTLNPFELFKILKKNQSSAPAKGGQIAPDDIWVEEGPTPFAPGPVIGELGTAGIKAGIEGGKVIIKQKSLAVKKGEKIPANTAAILTRLKIEPMKIGINLIAAFEGNEIYTKESLDFDEDALILNIKQAQSNAFALCLERSIINSETIKLLVAKAHGEAKTLAIEKDILNEESRGFILSKAEGQAQALDQKVQSQ